MSRIYRCTLSCALMGSVCQNVLHFDDFNNAVSLEQAAQDIRDNWLQAVKQSMWVSAVWFNINMANISASPQPTAFNLTVSIGGVIGGGDTVAPFASTLFTIRTDIGGRSGRGRFYLPGVGQTFFVNGILTAPTLAHINTNTVNPLEARYLPGGTSPLVLGIIKRGDPSTFKSARNIEVRPTMGVQRRRNVGIGI